MPTLKELQTKRANAGGTYQQLVDRTAADAQTDLSGLPELLPLADRTLEQFSADVDIVRDRSRLETEAASLMQQANSINAEIARAIEAAAPELATIEKRIADAKRERFELWGRHDQLTPAAFDQELQRLGRKLNLAETDQNEIRCRHFRQQRERDKLVQQANALTKTREPTSMESELPPIIHTLETAEAKAATATEPTHIQLPHGLPSLETIATLHSQDVAPELIARIYGFVTADGQPEIFKVWQELDCPGCHTGPATGWKARAVQDYEAQQRGAGRTTAADKAARRQASASASSVIAPEPFDQLFRLDGMSDEQIARMKGCSLEEVDRQRAMWERTKANDLSAQVDRELAEEAALRA